MYLVRNRTNHGCLVLTIVATYYSKEDATALLTQYTKWIKYKENYLINKLKHYHEVII
jgi:hypothetical protein